MIMNGWKTGKFQESSYYNIYEIICIDILYTQLKVSV